jgi:alpha-ketoglutarate-dependent taurine dioxygenase
MQSQIHSNTKIQAVQSSEVITCSTIDDFQSQLISIYEKIEKYGFAIIQGWDTSDESFKEMAQFFGHLQDHPKADDFGVVKMRNEHPNKPNNAHERFTGYVGGDFLPHTDGAYLDGYGVVNNKVVKLNPPQFLILQCIQPAEQGGASFIVDTQEIFHQLWHEEPEHMKVVTQAKAVNFCLGDIFSTYCPIFEQISNENWRVRLRSDIMYIEPWAYDSVKHIVQNYLLNPKFRKLHRLTEGQILITDNHRVLHGRDAVIYDNIEKPRLLNKTLIWDESTENILPFMDPIPDPRSFRAFDNYLPLNVNSSHKRLRPIQTGIKLK